MKDCNEQTKCLASLAVFRELYNKQKDVYGVISEFLNEIIASSGKFQFSLTEITFFLNDIYDFSIPEAVVRTALGRLEYLKKEQGVYVVLELPDSIKNQIPDLQKEIRTNNDIIIDSLFSFIEAEKKVSLNDKERAAIVHSLCSFLLDDSNGELYAEYISAFIVQNKNDLQFRTIINKIREGVILYSGLKYSSNLNDLGSWKTELTIYIDTEILFHFAGFNGELYKTLFNDFFSYVKEINSKSAKKLIKLKYFSEVKAEIEGFFTKAKYILEGKEKPNVKGTAMNSIIDGCIDPSDVQDKKSDFYLLLQTNGIQEEDSAGYYNADNFQYNIIDQKTIDILSNEIEIDVSEHLQYLNFISIIRKEAHSNNFDNIGCILLTGNSKTIKIAWHELVKPDGCVPLATTLGFLTNKFWFKLNKGFGNGSFPKSFDIITKAQIMLATELNDSLGEKYEELQVQFKNGKLTEEQAKARIVNLRQQVRKPEDIDQDDVLSILDVISEDTLEQFIQEQEHFKNDAAKQAIENVHLKESLSSKEKELEIKALEALRLKKENKQKELEIVRSNISAKEMLIEEKKANKRTLERQGILVENKSKEIYKNFRLKAFGLLILLYLIVSLLIWKLDWNTLEPLTFIIGILISNIVPFLFLLFYEKDINPKRYLETKKNEIYDRICLKFDFDKGRINQLNIEISELTIEIDALKKANLQVN